MKVIEVYWSEELHALRGRSLAGLLFRYVSHASSANVVWVGLVGIACGVDRGSFRVKIATGRFTFE